MQPLPPPDDTEVVGYRWQMALADTASMALLFSGSRAGASVGALSYVLAGPVIHGAHDEGGRTAASLALRIGLPLAGAFGFAALARSRDTCAPSDDDCDDGSLAAVVVGFGLGMLTAMVVDDVLLARPVTVHKESSVRWAPQVTATSQRVSLGVLGRF